MLSKWDKRFLGLAKEIATWSKDSTGFGAIIVGPNREIISTGYNGFPMGVDDNITERWKGINKYLRMSHAERNSIYLAARRGVQTEGCTMYLSGISNKEITEFPCAECAIAIIQAGISKIVCGAKELTNYWKESMELAAEMFNEAGIEVVYNIEEK